MMQSSTPILKISAVACAVASALALSACGGGSAGTASTNSNTTVSTASYSGTVSGLGSIVVNGVRFSTTGADTLDGDDPSQPFTKALPLGATVTVTGTVNDATQTGQASQITVHGGVRGQVSAVDATAMTLTVDGQLIKVDANTVFEARQGSTFTLATIAANVNATTPVPVYVEVYGVADANNTVVATRIEEETSADLASRGHAIKGAVSNLLATSASAGSFDLTLRSGVIAHVSYDATTVFRPDLLAVANGSNVRVLFSSADAAALKTATSGTTVNVTATKVLVKRDKQSDGTTSKLQGAIKAISGTTWTIGDVSVDVSQSPKLEGSITLANATVGTIVKVKGTFTNGVLVASSIESDDHERVLAGGTKLYGAVSASTDNSGLTPATASTFVVQGLTVTMTSATRGNLPTVGTYVEVLAQTDAQTGLLNALKVETQASGSSAFEVYGTVPCSNGQSDLATIFTLTQRTGALTVDGSTATIKAGKKVDLLTPAATGATLQCLVEVKGSMALVNNINTLQATAIEVKLRAAPLVSTAR